MGQASVKSGGPVALVGGAEYLAPAAGLDAWLLERSGSPVVTVVPTAARQHPEMAVATARRHFAGLGAQVAGAMVLDRADAEDATHAEALAGARFLYLAGGDPRYLAEVLRGSAAWQAILAAQAGGAVLAGSSAGAMVLCDQMSVPGSSVTTPGVGLIDGVIVLPHHNRARDRAALVARQVAPGTRLLGVDEATGLVLDGDTCHVLGAGGAVLYEAGGDGAAELWRHQAPATLEACL